MSITVIAPPYPVFTDTNGKPLDNGEVYIGEVSQDPSVSPIQIYWDYDLTIPATQPISTLNGYPSRRGTAAQLYANTSSFSIMTKDKHGATVMYSPVGYGIVPTGVSGSVQIQRYSGDGSTLTFALPFDPESEDVVSVYVAGLHQSHDGWSLSGTTLTFIEAPPEGTDNIEVILAEPVILGYTETDNINYTPTGSAAPITLTGRLDSRLTCAGFGVSGEFVDNLGNVEGFEGAYFIALGKSGYNDGGDGIFIFDASDLSTEVAADTLLEKYVAPISDPIGTSGAWVRAPFFDATQFNNNFYATDDTLQKVLEKIDQWDLTGVPYFRESPSSDFDWFTYYISASGVVYSTPTELFDITLLAPSGGSTYYVSPTGSDSTGTGTEGAPWQSVAYAISQAADNDTIILQEGIYYRAIGTFGTLSGKSLAIKADYGAIVEIGTHDNLTWSLNTGSTYQATRSSIGHVYDSIGLNPSEDYEKLTERTSIAEVDANPGSWYTDGITVYVRTSDSRSLIGDTDIRAYLKASCAVVDTDGITYLENIYFTGGTHTCQIKNGGVGESVRCYAKNCSFKYSVGADGRAIYVLGATTIFEKCVAAYPYNDCFSYNLYNSTVSRGIEINCTGRNAGQEDGAVTSQNGSTSHDGSSVVRVQGEYYDNYGPNVADTGIDTAAWNIGVISHDSTVGAVNQQDANFQALSTAEVWCDQCQSYDSEYDYVAVSDAVLYKHGGSDEGNDLEVSNGTIETY